MGSYGLRIRDNYKIIPLKFQEEDYDLFSYVIVETNRGEECGQIIFVPENLFRAKRDIRIVRIIRLATKEDLKRLDQLAQDEKKMYKLANAKLTWLGKTPIKIVHCEVIFSGERVIFYYRENDTEDNKKKHRKINVREITKELSDEIRKNVEFREVGDRGAAKIMGGLGPCGRVYCCTSWLAKTKAITVKMAKEQSMTINIPKLSGGCNRLKCCLRYELENYTEGKLKEGNINKKGV